MEVINSNINQFKQMAEPPGMFVGLYQDYPGI